MIGWRLIQQLMKAVVLGGLVLSEKSIGVPFASWLWLYEWYGQEIWQRQWYLGVIWALMCSLVYQMPLGLVLGGVLIWVWAAQLEGKHTRRQKWWLLLITSGVALAFTWYLHLDFLLSVVWIVTQSLIWIWVVVRPSRSHHAF